MRKHKREALAMFVAASRAVTILFSALWRKIPDIQ
jgi:hypothetical protein